jgi:KUP system potassium uptake protein
MSGGTFALYSLLCRHAKINIIPNQHRTDEALTTYSRHTYDEKSLAAKIKRWLEGHRFRKNIIFIIVLFGTCMAIGDGILTPAISGGHLCLIIGFVSKSLMLVFVWRLRFEILV